MKNSQTNNPVGHLLILVDKARQIPSNVSQRDGWAKLCNHDPKDVVAVLSDIANFSKLVNEAKKAIEQLDGLDQSLYLRPIKRLEEILGQINLNQQWQSVVGSFDETTVYGLSIGSDLLSKLSKEKVLEEETQKDLLEQINKLIQDVIRSDFSQEMKSFLIEQLEKFRNALINYKIFGQSQLREAIENATGAFVINAKDMIPYWDKPVVKNIIAILTTLANIVTVYQGGQLLAEGIMKLLTSGK